MAGSETSVLFTAPSHGVSDWAPGSFGGPLYSSRSLTFTERRKIPADISAGPSVSRRRSSVQQASETTQQTAKRFRISERK